jgi:hypothetical protein
LQTKVKLFKAPKFYDLDSILDKIEDDEEWIKRDCPQVEVNKLDCVINDSDYTNKQCIDK